MKCPGLVSLCVTLRSYASPPHATPGAAPQLPAELSRIRAPPLAPPLPPPSPNGRWGGASCHGRPRAAALSAGFPRLPPPSARQPAPPWAPCTPGWVSAALGGEGRGGEEGPAGGRPWGRPLPATFELVVAAAPTDEGLGPRLLCGGGDRLCALPSFSLAGSDRGGCGAGAARYERAALGPCSAVPLGGRQAGREGVGPLECGRKGWESLAVLLAVSQRNQSRSAPCSVKCKVCFAKLLSP